MNIAKRLTFGLILLLAAASSQANLVNNGGFESGLSGWTTSGLTCSGTGGSFNAATGCYGMDSDPGAYSGNSALYLGTAAGNGVVSQSIATAALDTYNVSFWLGNGAYNGQSAPNDLLVAFGGQTLLHLINAPAQAYTFYSYDVISNSATALLSFTNLQAPSFWVIDNVTVNQVPEPTTLALMGVALAGLCATRRRKATA